MFEMNTLFGFVELAASLGVHIDEPLRCDGRVHRVLADGDYGRKRAGWYRLYSDGHGRVGNWRTDEREDWFAPGLSPRDKDQLERDAQAQREVEKKRQRRAAQRAAHLWRHASSDPVHHPYLRAKRIPPCGARWMGWPPPHSRTDYRLIVPVHDLDDQVHSLQLIRWDGEKKFLPGGATRGHFCALGNWRKGSPVFITEGFATAATIHLQHQKPVLAAFSAGNLRRVARALRRRRPYVRIIIAADNDRHRPGNPGVAAGIRAADAVHGFCVWPDFPAGTAGTDFNDLVLVEPAA